MMLNFLQRLQPFLHLFLLIGLIQMGLFYQVDLSIILLSCMALEIGVGRLQGHGISAQIQRMKQSVFDAFDALLIFMVLGPLIAVWVSAGSIPYLIYHGFAFQNPSYFLPLTFVICSLSSMVTGTSWGTASTVGLVLLVMGESLGIPNAMTAGAIVSGAFLGDKMSPISDSTNLAAANVKVSVQAHVLAMSYTAIPAFFIALALYAFLGLNYQGAVQVLDHSLPNALLAHFSLSLWSLLPFGVLIFGNVMRWHAVVSMFLSVVVGIGVSLLLQNTSIAEIPRLLMHGYTKSTGFPLADDLLLRGGLAKFSGTFVLCCIALCFGGLVGQNRLVEQIISPLVEKIKSPKGLSLLVLLTGFLSVLLMGEIYLGILMTTQFFLPIFHARKMPAQLLSRFTEESATLMGPLIPWTTASIFMYSTLGVKAQDYIWFCFFNLANLAVSIGFILFRKK